MIVRKMRAGDQEAVQAIHAAMGLDYKLPDLSDGDLVQIVEQDGRVIGASMNRVVAETYLWIDPTLDPRDKWTAIRLGQQEMVKEGRKRGWRELIAMVPEIVTCKFAKRLLLLRWERQRTGWQMWERKL